ncbi:RsiV family protein [Luteimonas sp. e5]
MPAPDPVAASSAEAAPEPLTDVVERSSRYLVGITFPEVANAHPPLAAALREYADQARNDLDTAVSGAADIVQSGLPYDLSLNFTDISPRGGEAVVIAADGSLYTGGAHGIPLIARFTYLPGSKRILSARDLVSANEGWQAISDYVRAQLREGVAERLEEDGVAPDERADISKRASAMIDEGTLPDAANFDQFEPIPAASGKWFGLRFVFPPYQVGPYSDGTQSVEVPARILLPHLAPEYRELFEGS